jgi:hypothetical protein
VDGNEDDPDWVMIGIVVGAVVTLLILMLVGLYLYFFLMRRKHQKRRAKNVATAKSKSSGVNADLHHTSGSDSSSYESDPKNSSSNQLVPKISTISSNYKVQQAATGALPEEKVDSAPGGGSTNTSTSFGNGLTPTYWSASQLLKEHEERKRRESMARDTLEEPKNGIVPGENLGYDYNAEEYPPQYGYYDGGINGTMADTYHQQQQQQQQQQNNYYNTYSGYPVVDTQRFSTADSTVGGYNGGLYPGYHPMPENQFNVVTAPMDPAVSSDTESTVVRANRATAVVVPKNSGGGSEHSSSGIVANPSLRGSLLSLNTTLNGRPASTLSKTRNITQV